MRISSAIKTITPSTSVTVIGLQWGDEGKGKIVDGLSSMADAVIRFQGGHNAGHTLVIDGQRYVLSLLPSGIMRAKTSAFIGAGVVVDPWALKTEIEGLRQRGVDIGPDRLMIANNATVILPSHQQIDLAREQKALVKIGTTGRGIGPAYEDRAGRRALRLIDLVRGNRAVFDAVIDYHNGVLRGLGADPVEADNLYRKIEDINSFVAPFIGPVWSHIAALEHQSKKLLFEGAQGVMLDITHGTYPFVTSSNTIAGAAAIGAGTGKTGYVLGISKAYTTRVGEGPFPTELNDAIGQHLGEQGCEFGAVTGRQRRCGWLDAVLLRYACALSGVDGIALTKLDVLDGLETIKICVGYGNDQAQDYSADSLAQVEPVYEEYSGWSEKTAGITDFKALPANAKRYIGRIEELVQTPITMVSTGADRNDMITLHNPFILA